MRGQIGSSGGVDRTHAQTGKGRIDQVEQESISTGMSQISDLTIVDICPSSQTWVDLLESTDGLEVYDAGADGTGR